MKRLAFFLLFLALSIQVPAQGFALYGGRNHQVFLGWLDAPPTDAKSVWNRDGAYGSALSETSIWNRYGSYGSQTSDYSPWKKYAAEPPFLLDSRYQSQGLFTVTGGDAQTKLGWALWILSNYDLASKDQAQAYRGLFATTSPAPRTAAAAAASPGTSPKATAGSPALPAASSRKAAGSLALYGGKDHRVFLGWFDAPPSDPDSLWNASGPYGSSLSQTSIWNRFGPYGSASSDYSPWKKYAAEPPLILDARYQSLGAFSLTEGEARTTLAWALWVLSNYDYASQNPADAYQMFFSK